VIEHLDYHHGQFMLRECFRVLRPGARLRIATPDLQVFVNLYGDQANTEQRHFLREYVRFNTETWSTDLKHVRNNQAVFVLNHNFRAWGHQFIYDYQTLEEALLRVGFEAVSRQSPQLSQDENLNGLELRQDIVGIFDALIVEAQKPLKRLKKDVQQC
jgi:predicted SAM-dependent methyltransferase